MNRILLAVQPAIAPQSWAATVTKLSDVLDRLDPEGHAVVRLGVHWPTEISVATWLLARPHDQIRVVELGPKNARLDDTWTEPVRASWWYLLANPHISLSIWADRPDKSVGYSAWLLADIDALVVIVDGDGWPYFETYHLRALADGRPVVRIDPITATARKLTPKENPHA